MIEQYENYQVRKDYLLPTRIMDAKQTENIQELLVKKDKAISWRLDNCAKLSGKGASLLLDFGKELCGGLLLVTRSVGKPVSEDQPLQDNAVVRLKITFGESVSEACAQLGEKNSLNAHATRVMEVLVPTMSVQEYGMTGFRFAKIELLEDAEVLFNNVYAYCTLPLLEQEAKIVTNDPLLNQIIDTAAYTLKLCFQQGLIWDGIKRDRLVWCGDMHPEILTSIYAFGKTDAIPASLDFLRENTPKGAWVNNMPCYSAWWVANLCEYCDKTGDEAYFAANADYAREILDQFNALVDDDGTMHLPGYFLDWPTAQTPDAYIGAAALLVWTAKRYLTRDNYPAAAELVKKLSVHLNAPVEKKQTKGFQLMAGGDIAGAKEFLEAGGARGMSTFMSYYILTGAALAGSDQMLNMLKDFYGGMLSRGATSFWEDFDMDWLAGSSRIDELPEEGQTDLHGDYGKFCYTQFRHSLCHGWSSGVLAFLVEHIVGLKAEKGFTEIRVEPHSLGLTDVDAEIPTPYGMLHIHTHNGETAVEVPEGITLLPGV